MIVAMQETAGFQPEQVSLFGLVLAIGIVVDDAIVVVESGAALARTRAAAARSCPQSDGRSDQPGNRRGFGAVCRVRAVHIHQRHHRANSSANSPSRSPPRR